MLLRPGGETGVEFGVVEVFLAKHLVSLVRRIDDYWRWRARREA
jgi:hypothetical protein